MYKDQLLSDVNLDLINCESTKSWTEIQIWYVNPKYQLIANQDLKY